MNINELQQAKRKVEEAKSRHDVSKGKLEAITAEIKALGYDSIKDMQQAMTLMQEEINKRKAELNELSEAWREKYAEILQG